MISIYYFSKYRMIFRSVLKKNKNKKEEDFNEEMNTQKSP